MFNKIFIVFFISLALAIVAQASQDIEPDLYEQESQQLNDTEILSPPVINFERLPVSVYGALAQQLYNDSDISELEKLRLAVMLGQWSAVQQYFIDNDDAELYEKILTDLYRGFANPAMVFLGVQDIMDLADAAPGALTENQLRVLADMLQVILLDNVDAQLALLKRLRAGTDKLGGAIGPENITKNIDAARLLLALGMIGDMGEFLPDLDYCKQTGDIGVLRLHLNYLVYRAQTQTQASAFDDAWMLVQDLLLTRPEPQITEALLPLAVKFIAEMDNAPAVHWLQMRFSQPQNTEIILAMLKILTDNILANLNSPDIARRQSNIHLLNNAMVALLKSGQTQKYADIIDSMVFGWLAEADLTIKQLQRQRPQNQEDGHFMYQQMNREAPRNLSAQDLLFFDANQDWLAYVNDDLYLRFLLAQIRLCFNTGDMARAWDNIIAIDENYPELTARLLNEFLLEWSRHINNAPLDMNVKDPYMYRHGYGPGPQYTGRHGLPLTRARQKRNLQALAQLCQKIQAATVTDKIQPATMVKVFADCHSAAEVFRIEDIDNVFGSVEKLSAAVRIALIDTMRQKLMETWADIEIQQQENTNRNEQEMINEVARGYATLEQIADVAADMPSWQLHRLRAMVIYDCAEFFYTLRNKQLPEHQYDLASYTAKRQNALAVMAHAADLYALQVDQLQKNYRSPAVYLNWFYMVLGASDLAHIKRSSDISIDYLDDIRQSIKSLPDALAHEHFNAFADSLNDLLAQAPAHSKYRLLQAALTILADNPAGDKARQQINYYEELLDELQLRIRIDSDSSSVGHNDYFGAFIELCHSVNVERENNGFSRYLQNTDQNYYSYNRPAVNYRDNFQQNIYDSLQEKFEIHSLTFAAPTVQSREYGRDNWRLTPMAYIVLKPKDSAVDNIPPLQLDMDFVDNQNQVVLPVRSGIIGIDARGQSPVARAANASVMMILDGRKFDDTQIARLDIQIQSDSLIPPLENIIDLTFEGFSITDIVDNGLVVDKLDIDAVQLAPRTQRLWRINLKAQEGVSRFYYPQLKDNFVAKDISFKFYDDADVIMAQNEFVDFTQTGNRLWLYLIILPIILGLAWLLKKKNSNITIQPVNIHSLPPTMTPFTVLSFLRHIEADNNIKIPASQQQQFQDDIKILEQTYFSPKGTGHIPDLQAIAHKWHKISHSK